MTQEELDTYMTERRPAFEAWQASIPPEVNVEEVPLLTRLNQAFNRIPEPYQAQFIPSYALVRQLLDAERPDLARSYVVSLPVPPELQPIKDQILALFP